MRKIIIYLLISAWVLLALGVRIKGLEQSPLSLNFDEAALGYNAYSIMLTGRDEYGTFLPLSLRSFNDFKPALYSYLTVPFIYFFGLNQTSTRAVSAVFGTLSLFILLLIFKQISKASWLKSLFIVAILSFLPWRLHFSRVAFESNLSMAFFTMAFWCLFNFDKKNIYRVGSILFAVLSIYSYHSARLAIPLLVLFLLLDPLKTNWKDLVKHPGSYLQKIWPLFFVILLYTPILLKDNILFVLTRLQQTNIFNHFYPYTPGELIPIGSNPWSNILANPLYYLFGMISGHLFSYFSPRNLSQVIYPFIVKSPQLISGSGMIGWMGGSLFIIGLIVWLKGVIQSRDHRFLLYWIMAGIAPAIITWEWFHPLRSLNIYPAIDIIVGLGLLFIINTILSLKTIYKFIPLALLLIIVSVSSLYNLTNEYNYSIWDTNGEYQPGGFKESASLLSNFRTKYKTVYIDSPHSQSYVMLAFYLKYPPAKFQTYSQTRTAAGTRGMPNFNFDNFVYKKYDWLGDKSQHDFVYFTESEVVENEISSTPGAKLYKIPNPIWPWTASIITKE